MFLHGLLVGGASPSKVGQQWHSGAAEPRNPDTLGHVQAHAHVQMPSSELLKHNAAMLAIAANLWRHHCGGAAVRRALPFTSPQLLT